VGGKQPKDMNIREVYEQIGQAAKNLIARGNPNI
jgi:hypothetical protein